MSEYNGKCPCGSIMHTEDWNELEDWQASHEGHTLAHLFTPEGIAKLLIGYLLSSDHEIEISRDYDADLAYLISCRAQKMIELSSVDDRKRYTKNFDKFVKYLRGEK